MDTALSNTVGAGLSGELLRFSDSALTIDLGTLSGETLEHLPRIGSTAFAVQTAETPWTLCTVQAAETPEMLAASCTLLGLPYVEATRPGAECVEPFCPFQVPYVVGHMTVGLT